MGKNVCRCPTVIYITTATFQYLQWHFLFPSKVWPCKLCWWQYYLCIRQKGFYNYIYYLSHEFTIRPKWFYNNFMVLNQDKCSFLSLSVDYLLKTNLVCDDEILTNSKQEKVLGVKLDNKFIFATHLLNISKNDNKNLNALTQFQKYMTTD